MIRGLICMTMLSFAQTKFQNVLVITRVVKQIMAPICAARTLKLRVAMAMKGVVPKDINAPQVRNALHSCDQYYHELHDKK